jgi:hypothetical protein
MKLLPIDDCEDCKHHSLHYDTVLCGKSLKDIPLNDYAVPIPSWCPLPDSSALYDKDICQICGEPLMCGQDGLPFCFGCGSTGDREK